jgi:hypothetical protein
MAECCKTMLFLDNKLEKLSAVSDVGIVDI